VAKSLILKEVFVPSKNWSAKRYVGKKKKLVDQSPLRMVYGSFEEVMGLGMTEAQNEVFLAIDEWWKKFHYGPSYRDIILLRGKGGLGSTKKIVDRLVKIGAVKRVEGMGRSVRPCYLDFRNIE
jgi:hypothetical protein